MHRRKEVAIWSLAPRNKKLLLLTFVKAQVCALQGFLTLRLMDYPNSTLAACLCSPRIMRNILRVEVLIHLPIQEIFWFKRMTCFSDHWLEGHEQPGGNGCREEARKEEWERMLNRD